MRGLAGLTAGVAGMGNGLFVTMRGKGFAGRGVTALSWADFGAGQMGGAFGAQGHADGLALTQRLTETE